MEWNPSDLCTCVGSDRLGWLTAILCVGVCVWYAVITLRWIESAKRASATSRRIWTLLAVIFIVCAGAGYATMALATVFPKTAVTIRIVLLIAQNIACPFFVWRASRRQFTTISRNESIGSTIIEAVSHGMSDRELASTARTLVTASIERYASST